MKKKSIIWISAVAGVIALLIISMFTLFGMHSAQIKFHSETPAFASETAQNNIIKSAEFNYGAPVFFMDKQTHITKLERANPLLKVINLEITFPGAVVIHATQREPYYALATLEAQYILDNELKVLEVTAPNAQHNCITLSGVTVQTALEAGEFLNVSHQDVLTNLSPAFTLVNRNIAMQKTLMDSVEIYLQPSALNLTHTPTLELTDGFGMRTIIRDAHQHLEEKIVMYFDLLERVTPAPDSTLLIYENLNAEIVAEFA